MSLDYKTLGARLRQARENRRLLQEDAADALGLPRTAIVQMEAGNRSVSAVELASLARLYLRPVADFLAEDNLAAEGGKDDLIAQLHRMDPAVEEDPAAREQIARCLDLCREGSALKALLGLARSVGPPVSRFPAPSRPGESIERGLEVAAEERRRLGLGDAPIPDVARLIGAEGIWVSSADLKDEVSGVFFNDRAIGMAIVVNSNHRPTRRRFSLAHEYAHALLDRDRRVTVSSSENSAELIEIRANSFAAAFLLPPGGVASFLQAREKGGASRQSMPVFDPGAGAERAPQVQATIRPAPGSQKITYQDAAELADWFGVSYQAAVYRLANLGRLKKPEMESLLEKHPSARAFLKSRRGGGDEDDSSPRPVQELESQITYLAVEAYRREAITADRLKDISEKLGRARRELFELAQAALDD